MNRRTQNIRTSGQLARTAGRLSGISWEAVLSHYIASMQQKSGTRRTYRNALRRFFSWADSTGRDFTALRREDIIVFRDSLQNSRDALQPRTVSLYMTAVHQFYLWLNSETGYPNIARDIRGAKLSGSSFRSFERQPLSNEQASRLLSYFREYHPAMKSGRHAEFRDERLIALRDYAIVSTMLRCGLRTIEVSRLRVRNVAQRGGRRVLYIWGKGREAPGAGSQPDDFVSLTDKAYAPIASYLEMRGPAGGDEPLFANLSHNHAGEPVSPRTVQALCKRGLRAIGLDGHDYTAHSLRHTTGETLAEQGVPLLDIQTALRHRNPSTTEIYIAQAMQKRKLEHPAAAVLDDFFDADEQ